MNNFIKQESDHENKVLLWEHCRKIMIENGMTQDLNLKRGTPLLSVRPRYPSPHGFTYSLQKPLFDPEPELMMKEILPSHGCTSPLPTNIRKKHPPAPF